ncbi:MAG: penicillin-binding transpeptidase domain-containing protein [Pyrinomonadaceae bacterium]
MKFMLSANRVIKLPIAVLIGVCLFTFGANAQSRKSASTKKASVKKTEKQSKDARKNSKAPAKVSAKSTKSKSDSKRGKNTEKANAKSSKKKVESKKEAARRRAAEERRQAELAEKRRREQAAREARERKLALERGFHTETARNIQEDNSDGEDLQVRRAAVNALGSHAGTVVVMEAKTGKLLTVVNQDWAISEGFKPCSTIKLVTAVAGLNEDVINEEGGIGESTSGMKLDYAIAKSNNGYFQRVGSNFGNAKMIEYAKKLGLGQPTGINAEGETAGKLPYGNNNPRIYSHGDDFEVTPLQLAVMVSALSNGGHKVVPYIPKGRVQKTAFRSRPSRSLDIPQASFEGVLPGMVGAAEYGTARRGVDASMGVAGKTGSCISKGSWVGLFASIAPVEDPKYSVVVITRGQSERGRYAAAIAGKIYEELRPRLSRKPDSIWARKTKNDGPPADEQTAGLDNEEDDQDSPEQDDAAPIVVGRAAQPAVRKLVRKTTQSKPVLKPVIIEYDRSGAENGTTRPRVVIKN